MYIGLEKTNNLNHHTSSCIGPIPEIELMANNRVIVDGDSLTSMNNNTYFGSLPLNSDDRITRNFIIKNLGLSDLHINELLITGSESQNFSSNLNYPLDISPGQETSFQIAFSPLSSGVNSAKIIIFNNDHSENQFSFKVQADSSEPSESPLMISQYYEGTGNNKWVEVTNISERTTEENRYYLCLFRNEDALSPVGRIPSIKTVIPAIGPGKNNKILCYTCR